MRHDITSSRESLAAMIRKSTLLSNSDQAILLTCLDAMTEATVLCLSRLFEREQNQIQHFYSQALQIKNAYQRDLIKTKKKFGSFLEQRQHNSDADSIDSLLTDLP